MLRMLCNFVPLIPNILTTDISFEYLFVDLEILEDFFAGGALYVPAVASVCLALLEAVLANRRLGDLDLLLDLNDIYEAI